MKSYFAPKLTLEKDEVFVFGGNKHGFSGAGSAGYATFNKPGNHWRAEKYDERPHGWLGCWNVKGCAEGFQVGTIGKSYAIPTVTKPGEKKSISLHDIGLSVRSFYAFAISRPNLNFFVAQGGKIGLNGWSPEEMASCYLVMRPPENVYFEDAFYKILKSK
jgi:hypothetical protein